TEREGLQIGLDGGHVREVLAAELHHGEGGVEGHQRPPEIGQVAAGAAADVKADGAAGAAGTERLRLFPEPGLAPGPPFGGVGLVDLNGSLLHRRQRCIVDSWPQRGESAFSKPPMPAWPATAWARRLSR